MRDSSLDSGGKYVPNYLLNNPTPDILTANAIADKEKFQVVCPGLKIDSNYAFQFQYVFADGTLSDWSPAYTLNTTTETVPGAPTVTVPSSAIGNIPVTLSAFPANAKRVDIYIIGGVYGTGKVADSFLQAGTKNIPVVAGVYQVSLITVSPSGINGDPTNTFTITISNVATEDSTPPDSIISATASSGIRSGDSSGQLGYINLAIVNGTIPTDFSGYIVKIVESTNSWTQTFNSTTALSNLYIGNGILVGRTYSLSVATTDGKNISSYINASPSTITVTDNRTNNSTVSGSLSFSATDSILTVKWNLSTDINVDSYKVDLTTNADTGFASILQTVYSKGNTASFGDLTAGTTYRVRVTTKYGGSTGLLSSSNTTGTFTLDTYGAISDGVAPTTNPNLTTSMVKSLFGAFAITFPAITNPDAVTYEVFIKPTNATGIVNNTYKVLEVGGTFAVVKTLADKTTALSYGTDYYIAIRAKDNDGVSTGTVTAVGPVQTLQVSTQDLADLGITEVKINTSAITEAKIATNAITETKIASNAVTSAKIVAGSILADKIAVGAVTAEKIDALAVTADKIAANAITAAKISAGAIEAVAISAGAITANKIAADAVLANNIKAGEIDASKMTTDLLFTNKTINVGESTSLNRIRLDANTATINDFPSGTFSVKSRIYIGAGNYYSSGTSFYADNTGRFSIADKLRFDGTNLTINGSGTFTGTVTAGSGANTVAIGNSINGANSGIYVGATGDYIYTDGRIRLGNGGITYASGVLTVTGNITANSIAANTSLSGLSITGTTGTFGGVTINSSGITSTNFSVTSTGILSAAAGTIGGWDINGTQLRSTGTNSITLNPNTPKIALLQSGVEKITIDPTEGIVGPTVTVNGNTGSAFKITPNGTAEFRGTIYASNGIFSGNISGGTFTLSGSPSTNYWTTSGFNLGAGVDTNGTAALINYDNSTSTITLVAGDTTSGSDTNSNPDGTGSAVGTVTGVKARIILKSTSGGLQLRGIPTLGDYTRYNYPYNYYTNVDANSANTSYGMGSAARLRTLIQDPYDHTVYRGFAVYYGQRSSAPSGSTGYVGDLWVSW